MDRDITTTTVSEMDTRHLGIRDDTTAFVTSGSSTSYMAEVHQMIDNFFANSYMHLPGQTIGNIDQDPNFVKKKGKGKKGKGKGKKAEGKGYNNNYYNYNYNHYNTYHHQSKAKGKGPIGSFDNNNDTGKGKHIKGDKNNKGKGKSTSSTSTSKCWVCGKLGHRAASCWYNSQKNINNVQQRQLPPQQQQFQLQGSSGQPIAYMPPEGITTFRSSSYHNNNNLNFSISRYDRHYPLPSTSAPQHHL